MIVPLRTQHQHQQHQTEGQRCGDHPVPAILNPKVTVAAPAPKNTSSVAQSPLANGVCALMCGTLPPSGSLTTVDTLTTGPPIAAGGP